MDRFTQWVDENPKTAREVGATAVMAALDALRAERDAETVRADRWKEMEKQQLTKTELAKRMQTSRAALNRLLDESDPSLTIATLTCAAVALGKRVEMNLT